MPGSRFWVGSSYDRQQRVAQSSQLFDQVHGTPTVLQGKDAFPPGQATLDTRRPPAYFARQRFAAQIAGNFDQVHNTPLALQGKDALPTVGQSSARTELPPRAPARARDYTYADASEFWIFGTDAMAIGESTYDTRRPAAYLARAYRYPVYDANNVNSLIPENVAVAAPFVGITDYSALPPRAAARSVDLLTYVDGSENWLFGTDAMDVGVQSFELPPRAAARARDYTYVDASEVWLFGTDAVNAGAQSFALPPLGAARARDYSLTASFPLTLIGQDQLNTGAQSVELPPHAALRERDYTWTQDLIPNLVGQDAMVTGQQSFTLAPSPAPLRARDYSLAEAFPLTLNGQDALNAGQQLTALPPIAALRSRDYSFVPPINLPCLTTVVQQIPYGAQLTDSLPPHTASRARDYTWSQDLIPNLIGQDAMATGQQSFALAPSPTPLRARDYSLAEAFPLVLISQDAMLVGVQSTALPPIGALRARDYTFAPPANLPVLTTVVQQIPYGAQLTDSLPPKTAARAVDLRTYVDASEFWLFGTDAFNAGQQSTALVPSPAPLRARDYSITEAFPLTLISQDQFNAGAQSYALPPIAALRSRDYSFVPPINLSCLTTVVQAIPDGKQSTDNLPPRGAARARDYTFTAAFPLTLIGRDAMAAGTQYTALAPKAPQRPATLTDPLANLTIIPASTIIPPGQQFTELSPKAAPRARDYTFLHPTDQQLIGKDAVNPGKSTFATDLPPKAPSRARDYTWLQTYQLQIFEQLPTGQSTAPTEGPPKGPLRLRDYTHLDLYKQNLAGQDALPTGKPWLLTDNLPPRAYPRMLDYTIIERLNLSYLAFTTRPGHHRLSDRALFLHNLSDRSLFSQGLTDRALTLHTDSSQEPGG